MWTQWERFDVQRMLPPGKALRMVTIDAARALGLGERIGSLEPGKRADVILVDFNRPHLVPSTAIARLLAFYVNGNDVETVIVDGRVLMEDGQVVTVDQDQVLERARRAAARAFERFDVEPYLEESEDFWEGWTY
jgi:cytosine/adenosine deaminase-related metal-dependent hydrolase